MPFPEINVSPADTVKADKDIVFRRSLAKNVVLEFCQKYNAEFKKKFNTNLDPLQKEQVDAFVKFVEDLPETSIRRDLKELVSVLKDHADRISKDFLKHLNKIVADEYAGKKSLKTSKINLDYAGFVPSNDPATVEFKNKLRDIENSQKESIEEINRLKNDLKETVNALKAVTAETAELNKRALKNESASASAIEPISAKQENLNRFLIVILIFMSGFLVVKFFKK